jgi:hypothetical protein
MVDLQRRQALWREVASVPGSPGEAAWARAVCAVGVRAADADAAALTLRAGRSQDMLAATHDWAERMEEEQYLLGEGPGVHAFTIGGPTLANDLHSDVARWPGFCDAAAAAGVTAASAFPLQIGTIRLGTLTLYWRRGRALSAAAVAELVVIADLITLALLSEAAAAERSGQDWIREPSSYEDVHVATGIVAARLHLSLNDAFARLRAHAFAQNRSMRELARDVIAQRIDLEEMSE